MSNAFPKLLTAIAAAALLAVSPVSAQTNGDQGEAGAEAGAQGEAGAEAGAQGTAGAGGGVEELTREQRAQLGETFRTLTLPPAIDVTIDATVGAAVPETAVLHPVPPEIIAAVPGTEGYEYFTLPDGRIVLVHPDNNTIAMVLD